MKVYNQEKTQELQEYDLEKGYLVNDTIIHHIPEVLAEEEISHQEKVPTERLKEDGTPFGYSVYTIIDKPAVVGVPAHDEEEAIQVYVPYTEEELDEIEKAQLKARRQTECFAICDRACWYDCLTQEQKEEVKAWRNAWLKVTETKVIPEKPDWI